MRLIYTLFLVSLLMHIMISQSLPAQWRKSDDGKYLIAGDQATDGLYDVSTVEEVRLYFAQTNYWTLLTQNYSKKVDIPCTLKYKDITLDSVGVRFKGQTSYSMNNTQKKSFSISTDAFKDQKLMGYENLNLNNAFQDPSFMREVLYYQLIKKHTLAVKANFVKVYLNDVYWGIYLNVQQQNKDFLQEWYESNDGINIRADVPDGTTTGGGPGGGGGAQWGDGTAAVNYLGTDTTLYKKYYTLKSSDANNNPWQELVNASYVLNKSGAALETEAPKYFDIDKILWHLACEIAFGDDDSYVYKGKMDYYLYQDAETQRWTSYDYDANSTLLTAHITWSPFYNETKVNYPLLNKLLAVPAFRQRYLAHMRTIIDELLDETQANNLIAQYDALINAGVMSDTKKGTTNAAYTSELTVLKNFIKNRKASLLSNAEVKVSGPVISNSEYRINGSTASRVVTGDEVKIVTNVSFADGIQQVNLLYCNGFSGRFATLTMTDDGQNGDATANDGQYTVIMPEFETGSLIRFYIEAIGNNTPKTRTYYPAGAEHHVMIYTIEAKSVTEKTIVINEFMASNTGVILDDNNETEDWIELYNTTSNAIDMSGFFISDSKDNLTKFEFASGTTIPANGYLIVWADEDKTQGTLHANFKLTASGESIYLIDKSKLILDSLTFGQQTANKSAARIPNGTGPFVIGEHTFGKNNNNSTAVDDQKYADLKIYPNPSDGNITIENTLDQNIKAQIYLSNGNLLNNIEIPSNSQTVYLLPCSGLYFIKTPTKTAKLVVIH
jgi:hypothetical protein